MAQVVIVYPRTGADIPGVTAELPLSILSCVSYVCREFDTACLDERIHRDFARRLRRHLNGSTVCVGVSAMTGPQIAFGLDVARRVRELAPDVPIVWGGIHASLLPEETSRHPLVDVAIAGEGEMTFLEVVRRLATGRDLDGLAGVYVDGHSEARERGPNEPPALDDLPELPYHLVDMEPYLSVRASQYAGIERALPFISSRGCSFGCTFCCNPALSNRRWRAMSVDVAARRVESLARTHGVQCIQFHDENFLGSACRAEEFAGRLGALGLKWVIQGRMSQMLKIDLDLLVANGLIAVCPGIETGSNRILDMIRKGESREQVLEANRRLAGTGIIAAYNFVIGFPTEALDEVHETMDFAIRLLDENPHAQVSGFYVYIPYPGTELAERCRALGFSPPQDLAGWARFSRQHHDTPWVAQHRHFYETIIYTAKFVDGKRLGDVLGSTAVPKWLIRAMGRMYRFRWRIKWLTYTPDIWVLNLLAKGVFRM